MTTLPVKLLKCFRLAQQVTHYYWVYTDADEKMGDQWRVSIENLRTIIERMIQIPIYMKRVLDENPTTRAGIERYTDRIIIYVLRDERVGWERFSAVKELCHALMDEPSEFSTDVVATIRELKDYSDGRSKLIELSESGRTEKLAEFLAVELMYPVEYRKADKEALEREETLASIGARRGIPSRWVEWALVDIYDEVINLWSLIGSEGPPGRLGPPVR